MDAAQRPRPAGLGLNQQATVGLDQKDLEQGTPHPGRRGRIGRAVIERASPNEIDSLRSRAIPDVAAGEQGTSKGCAVLERRGSDHPATRGCRRQLIVRWRLQIGRPRVVTGVARTPRGMGAGRHQGIVPQQREEDDKTDERPAMLSPK